MATMQRPTHTGEPIHWDNHRVPMNFTLVLSMVIAVFGMFTGQFVLFIVGMALAAYTWFTRPRRYVIYADALVVQFGSPRVKILPFSQISHVELLSLPIGDRLRVVTLNGRRTMIMARDLDTFREKLDTALESYQGDGDGTGQQSRREEPPGALEQPPETNQDLPEDAVDSTPGVEENDSPDFQGPPLR